MDALRTCCLEVSGVAGTCGNAVSPNKLTQTAALTLPSPKSNAPVPRGKDFCENSKM